MERFWSRHSVISFIWWLEHYFEKIKYFFYILRFIKNHCQQVFHFFPKQYHFIDLAKHLFFFSATEFSMSFSSNHLSSCHCLLTQFPYSLCSLPSPVILLIGWKSDTLSVVTIKCTLVVQSVSGERTSSRITSREYLLESETAIV